VPWTVFLYLDNYIGTYAYYLKGKFKGSRRRDTELHGKRISIHMVINFAHLISKVYVISADDLNDALTGLPREADRGASKYGNAHTTRNPYLHEWH
jgi:hypothetical protein